MFNLYTFGCSFTRYGWSTWADILGRYADHYENFGKRAAGNYFVFYQLIDFITTRDFEENDVIAVCWAPSFREDRIKDNIWMHSGPLLKLRTKEYDEDFVDKFFDPIHYLKRDRCFISASIEILEAKNIKYVMFSVDEVLLGFENLNGFFRKALYNIKKNLLTKYILRKKDLPGNKDDSYLKHENKLLYPMFEYLESSHQENRERPLSKYSWDPEKVFEDDHPTPLEHLDYVKNIILPKFPFTVEIAPEHVKTLEAENKKIFERVNVL